MEHALLRPVSDGAILTRSLEQILTVLIRMLVGKLSLVRLEELVRKIYVQESERRLKSDFPKKRVTLSQLALLTGIDTRNLTKITNSQFYMQPAHEDDDFLNEITPETRLINVWLSDPRFCDVSSGNPKALALEKGSPSFAELFACLKSTRGLTYQSVLARLDKAGSVEIDWDKEQVRLVSNNFYPFLSNDEPAMLELGFSTAASLLRTVENNIASASTGEEKLFQRITLTNSLSPQRRSECRQRLSGLLSQSYDECQAAMAELEDKTPKPGQITAGVSMFYFESDSMP